MIYLRFTSAIECEGDEQKQQQHHDILGCSAGKWRHNHRTSGKNIYSSEHQYNNYYDVVFTIIMYLIYSVVF